MSNAAIALRGLTWGHRRAIAPLEAASTAFRQVAPDILVEWSVRDLSRFEHQPLEEVAAQYDLIVFDHPFTGRMAGSGLFRPVDDILAHVSGASDATSYIGPSLASYRWNDHVWGIPVDGATMHAAYREDLLARLEADVPGSWSDVIRLGKRARKQGLWLGAANGGHHGFLALGSLMHNLGASWAVNDGKEIQFSRSRFKHALELLLEAASLAPPEAMAWNSIALHDAMTARDDIVYCPLVYGYATYGEADFGARRLRFADGPGPQAPQAAGMLLGGAAIGMTATCREQAAAKHYLAFLLEEKTQLLFGRNHGQPALESAWRDEELNVRFNGYFQDVRESLERSAIRPRFDGYGRFESRAGNALHRFLTGDTSKEKLLEVIERLVEETHVGTMIN